MMYNYCMPFESVPERYEYLRFSIRFAIQDANFPSSLDPPVCSPSTPPDQLLTVLLESVQAVCKKQKENLSAKEAEQENEILAWVLDSLSDWTLNAEAAARHFAISERKVQSIARQAGEVSFSAYLQSKRMKRITPLLEETNLPVRDIGLQAGYSTSSAFFKAFQRVYGISPSEYRALFSSNES